MTRPAEAFEAGLLAMGYAVGGGRETPDLRMARKVLVAATSADPRMADAWLARLACGDRGISVFAGLWACRDRLGKNLSRYGLRPDQLQVTYESGMLIQKELSGPDEATAAYIAALCSAREFDKAIEVANGYNAATSPFTTFAVAALYYQTERWPQVIDTAQPLRDHTDPVLAAATRALIGHAQVFLGLHRAAVSTATEPLSNGKTITEVLPAATAGVSFFLGAAYRALGEETEAAEALRAALVADPSHRAAADLAADPQLRLATVDQASIESRSDQWDPQTAVDPSAAADADDAEKRHAALADARTELEAQIGLTEVKRELKKLEATVRANAAREAAGLPPVTNSRHVVLLGPPGTGKTTVARAVGKIYYGLGLLRSDKFIEVGQDKLVADFVGQTAGKTNDLIDSALDGVLMIDEAYAIVDPDNPGATAFGKQVIDTLVARIENDRDRLVVILAGYPAEMAQFLATNAGLASRFPKHIRFPSYTPAELGEIAQGIAKQTESHMDTAASALFERAVSHLAEVTVPDPRVPSTMRPALDVAGNGRFARNVIEAALDELNLRVFGASGPTERTADDMTTITEADMHAALTTVIASGIGEVGQW